MSTISILQTLIVDFGLRAFGAEDMKSSRRRAMRLVEEAIELAQSEQVDKEKLQKILDMVYDREPGKPYVEIADVMNTIIAYASCRGYNLIDLTTRRLCDLLGQPVEKFQKRAAEKREAGL